MARRTFLVILRGATSGSRRQGATCLSRRVDVRKISSHARCVGDIVDGQLRNERVHLHEERKRLPDAASSTQNRHLHYRSAVSNQKYRGRPQRGPAGLQLSLFLEGLTL